VGRAEVGELIAGRDGLLEFGGGFRALSECGQVDDAAGLQLAEFLDEARGDGAGLCEGHQRHSLPRTVISAFLIGATTMVLKMPRSTF